MKRKLTMIIAAITALLFLSPAIIFAQEEKEKEIEKKIEKRVKLVTVDESGEMTVIDTTISGDSDLEEIHLKHGLKWVDEGDEKIKRLKTKEGNVIIMKSDDDKAFSVYSKGDNKVISESGDVFILKKGDKDSFSIITIDEESGEDIKKLNIFIDEDEVHKKDGHIIMKSSSNSGHTYMVKVDEDGEKNIEWIEKKDDLEEGQIHIVIRTNNEVDDLIIDGDAVITIKDGKVKVDGDGVKMNIHEDKAVKTMKKKKEKKEIIKK